MFVPHSIYTCGARERWGRCPGEYLLVADGKIGWGRELPLGSDGALHRSLCIPTSITSKEEMVEKSSTIAGNPCRVQERPIVGAAWDEVDRYNGEGEGSGTSHCVNLNHRALAAFKALRGAMSDAPDWNTPSVRRRGRAGRG
jgi:hypothetical protein